MMYTHSEFLVELFPEDRDREFITNVGNDEDTSMLCMAIQDSLYVNETTMDEIKCNIICMVSFKVLEQSHLQDEKGCFVYYLGTLQGLSFNDGHHTNGSMNVFEVSYYFKWRGRMDAAIDSSPDLQCYKISIHVSSCK